MTQEFISVLSGIIFLAAYVPYLWAIWKPNSEVMPSLATWLVWAVVDTIVLYGMYSAGALNGQIVGATIGAWMVVASAFARGTNEWTQTDKGTLIAAVVCIILWLTFKSPLIGIVLGSLIIFIGGIPTFISAWKQPKNEDKTAWSMYFTACVLAMFAIPAWTLADATQPITFLIIDGTVFCLIIVRPIFKRTTA